MPDSPLIKLRSPPTPPTRAIEPAECDYAELDVVSNFSFLRGASHADELVFTATELGYRAIAIADVNSLAGVVRAYDACEQVRKQGGTPPKLIIGSRLVFDDAPETLVWATDRDAYARLCRLLTLGKRRTEKGQCTLHLADLLERNAGLHAGLVLPPYPQITPGLRQQILSLKEAFNRRLSLSASCLYDQDDRGELASLAAVSKQFAIPLLAGNHVHYHAPTRRPLQDVLTSVRHGCTVADAGYKLFPNAERYLKTTGQMMRLFRDHPQAIRRGLEIADACTFSLAELKYEYPDEVVPPGRSIGEFLAELTWQGAATRYPAGVPAKVRKLILHELRLIARLNFEAYFLTVHDLVKYARSRGILCQGRGSAANSAVCYCLGVTSVDPNQIDLLFERFISAARGQPPDIDVDFEHERREEVIQYVYEKYGRDRAGMTAEVITYRGRSAVRDVGKALGLSLDLVDSMAKKLDWWHRGSLPDEYLNELGLDPKDETIRRVIDLSTELLGFPRHLSQHVGGMVMTRGKLCDLVPIENASMPNRTVIEWDKDDIETLGILKVDALALGMLTAVSRAFRMVNERHEGTKARRHEVGTREVGDSGRNQDLPGSGGVAEVDGAGPADLPCDGEDAGGGAFRADEPDATGGGVDPVQHRRRIRPSDDGRLRKVPPHRPRVDGGVGDAMGACRLADDARRQPPGSIPPGRMRPNPARPDPEPGKQAPPQSPDPLPEEHLTPPPSPTTSCLRASVPSCLKLELHTIPPTDPAVYDMICDADTVGVFQIESRAQMSMLPRLRPRKFYDLVIEVAIVRPGPIQGNMVHPYLRRRNGEEPVVFPSPALEEVLRDTLGVPLFQEQAMKVVMVAAGFSADEADQLRRAMAAWRKGGAIDKFHAKIIAGMLRNGYTREFAEQTFLQIRGFGEYGFPESHAASFALIVYVSAWLKRYHPAEFCAALLNSQPMGFYAPAQLVRDAREHGVDVRPADVNHSDWDCTLEARPGAVESMRHSTDKRDWGKACPAVRLGLRMIKGLRQAHADQLATARKNHGPFPSISQFQRRTKLPRHAMKRLAEADAFASLGLSRRQALWQVMALDDQQLTLFDDFDGDERESTKLLPRMPLGREVMTDYATTSLSLKRHPVALVRPALDEIGLITSHEMNTLRHGRWAKVAGLVLIRQRPGTASGIVFETIEDELGVVNLIVRANIYDKYRQAARHAVLLHAEGVVERQGQVVHLMVWKMYDLSHLLNGFSVPSRDFH